MTPEERADFTYLLERASRSGIIRFQDRDSGISSNAMIAYAFGGHFPAEEQFPRDRDDYAACVRAARRAPRHHRRTLLHVLRIYRAYLREKASAA